MANAYIPDIELLQLMRSDDPTAHQTAFLQLSNDPSVQRRMEAILVASGIKKVSVAFLKEQAFNSLREKVKKDGLKNVALTDAYVQYWANLLEIEPILTGEQPYYDTILKRLFNAQTVINRIRGKVNNARLLNSNEEKAAENIKYILQEGIFRLLNVIKKREFRGDSALETFLISICDNVFFDLLKKKELELAELDDNLPAEEEENGRLAQEDADVIEAEYVKLEEKVLNDIPPDCRELLFLAHKEKRRNEEIAFIMGLALQTVKNKNVLCKSLLEKAIQKISDSWTFLAENLNIKRKKKS